MDNVPFRLRNRSAAAVAALGLAAVTTACGTEPDRTGPVQDPAAATGSAEAAVALEVLAPTGGDTVTAPFEVLVDTDADLGSIDDELHHLHVWFGEDRDDFETYESESAQIEEAPEGETTVWVQVHTFDHEPASDPVEVELTVEGGADGSEDSGDSGDSEDSGEDDPGDGDSGDGDSGDGDSGYGNDY